MSKINLNYSGVYPNKFSYARASKEAKCEIPQTKCPACRLGARAHTLMALGTCAGCRKDPAGYIKHLQELARKEKAALTRTANDTSKPR